PLSLVGITAGSRNARNSACTAALTRGRPLSSNQFSRCQTKHSRIAELGPCNRDAQAQTLEQWHSNQAEAGLIRAEQEYSCRYTLAHSICVCTTFSRFSVLTRRAIKCEECRPSWLKGGMVRTSRMN